MAQVTVVYRGTLAESIGVKSEEIQADKVADVMRHIKAAHGEANYKQAKPTLIVVNGISILQKKVYATKLSDGDVVSFLPLAAGG